MSKFHVDKEDNKAQAINRTIRIRAEYYDKLMQLSDASGVSFNKIVNQCIAYALDNLDEG